MSDLEIRVRRHPDTPGRTQTHSWTEYRGGTSAQSGYVDLDGVVRVTGVDENGDGTDDEADGELAEAVLDACRKVDGELDDWEAKKAAKVAAKSAAKKAGG